MKKVKRVGERYTTKEGYMIEVFEYFNANNCAIEFKNGLIIKNLTFGNIKKGEVKNPYRLSVYNMGYVGIGKYGSKSHIKIYENWHNLLRRCYDKKRQEKTLTYKDCFVDKRWHNFQNFAEWYDENYIESWQLDKDILFKGNKIYSPETCCFVPQEINKLFTKRQNKRGDLPIGVSKKGLKFISIFTTDNKTTYLGTFNTPEEAFESYKIAKEEYIKKVVDKWKSQITQQTYQALINYQVEITD